MNANDRMSVATLDPFAGARRSNDVAIAQALAAGNRPVTIAELCRQWVRLQEEYATIELLNRQQHAKLSFDCAAIYFEGVQITEEFHVGHDPPARRRVAQRAFRLEKRRFKAEHAALGLPEIEDRHDAVLHALDRLSARIRETPVRTLEDVAALLDAAMDSELDIEHYREDSPLLWHLVDGLKRLAPGVEMNATDRNRRLGRLFGVAPG